MSNKYENPLCKRYASSEMQNIFSDDNKFIIWRKLWIALAESERELGIDIKEEQIAEMKLYLENIDYGTVKKLELEVRHDVMAHILAYGMQCPLAAPIIHLGATSSYVVDNTDIILQRNALFRIKKLLINIINILYDFAKKYKGLSCLSYTHFQPAQPTTIGKRAAVWMQDLLLDLEQIDFVLSKQKLLGCRGATGNSASFLALFKNDAEKVRLLEAKILGKMGFDGVYPVSGQVYPRKVDYFVLSVLSGIAQSACKFSNDIRLMSHLKEIHEPFVETQVGSSAMTYKQNPIKCERIVSLARYVMIDTLNPALTASSQWLERTLDDSANRRIVIPESFLAIDAILILYINIVKGLTVYPKMIEKHLKEELPFILTENILIYCINNGGDRQLMQKLLRKHSIAVTTKIKMEDGENDLVQKVLNDKAFNIDKYEIDKLIEEENYIGMAKEQTEEFLLEVKKILDLNSDFIGVDNIEIAV